jgi:hypothetical protein
MLKRALDVVPVSELHIDFFIAAALQDREEDAGRRRSSACSAAQAIRSSTGSSQLRPLAYMPTGNPL